MIDQQTVLEIVEKTQQRREARRSFLRAAGGATVMAGGLSLLSACGDDDDDTPTPAPTPTPISSADAQDIAVLSFALQLEYLEAQFYSFAAFGAAINSNLLAGTGTQGAVITSASATTGTGVPRGVQFSDQVIAQYAREIAFDEIAHVAFLRTALGSAAPAQPAINISGGTGSPFAAAAMAAGIPGGSAFDPYANDFSFLLGAYIFEDVGVTAYKGAARLVTNKTYLEAAAGILAAEAYHAGLVRTILYNRGATVADLRINADRISDARDTLDGSGERDQGISGTLTASNIVPTDPNGIAFSRTTNQVLNIVYLNPAAGVTGGGFFPAGINGSIRTT
ncbi:MAG TPA: ferritin-like domain-containing protein [Sphingomonas sp.]|jgi:hypothetical protein|nr:ferritin-like domain-containing protein [Sphingomonas sp.]